MPSSYYFYAGKVTKTLNELRVSVFDLKKVPVPNSIVVTYAGLTYSKWHILGNQLHFHHSNPLEWDAFYLANYSDLDERAWIESGYLGSVSLSIVVTYDYLSWDTTNEDFDVVGASETLTVGTNEASFYYQIVGDDPTFEREIHESSPWSGHTRYQAAAPASGPIVVTDDTVEYVNTIPLPSTNEVSVDPIDGTIEFYPPENRVLNPSFRVINSGTGSALGWTKLDSLGAGVPPSTNILGAPNPVHGNRTIGLLQEETLYQTVRVRTTAVHHISFYAYVDDASPVRLTVNPVDASGYYRDGSNAVVGSSYTDAIEIFLHLFTPKVGEWNRFEAYIGEDGSFFNGEGAYLGAIPPSTNSLEVRIVAPSTNSVTLDCVQVHAGGEHAPYLGMYPDTTIEYECSDNNLYIPLPSDNSFAFNNVDINPLTSEKPDGFLAIYDIGDIDEFQLGKGGDSICDAGTAGNAVVGRWHMPYAETFGIGKIVERQTFHGNGWTIENTSSSPAVPLVTSFAELITPENAFTTDNGELHFLTRAGEGTVLGALFYDQFGNPVVGETVTISQVGSANTLNSSTTTNQGGKAYFKHVPLASQIRETVTFSIGTVSTDLISDIAP